MTARLPTELLQHIFLLGEHPGLPNNYDETKRFVYPPLRVSRRWRAAALSFPDLWTHIFLDEEKSSTCHSMPISVLEEWIERSGGQYLDVVLNYRSYNNPFKVDSRGQQIDLLVKHVHRWRKFSCKLDWGVFNQIIFPHLSKACALRELKMQCHLVVEPHIGNRLADQYAPNLIRLDLCNFPYIPFGFHRLGGESVTMLHLHDAVIDENELGILSNEMPQISYLRIEDCRLALYKNYPDGLFRNVEHLYYDCREADMLHSLLKGATCLKHLTVQDRVEDHHFEVLLEATFRALPSKLHSLNISVTIEDSLFEDTDAVMIKKVWDAHTKHMEELEIFQAEFTYPNGSRLTV
jgi:hypothetical protein